MKISRKDFIKNFALGAGGIVLVSEGVFASVFAGSNSTIKAIIVDYTKCTGCRTCEAVCSASNHKIEIEGNQLFGNGNPSMSNIKVWRYHPPVDVPITCFLCNDAPCVEACPVKPDAINGRKALYRDEVLNTIKCDRDRCIGCQSCSDACKKERGGVIFPDEEGSPTSMCTLCNGDPQCVKWCPYGALSFLEVTSDMPLREMSPDEIAKVLEQTYYGN
ncbi:MAG: iron-sulfur cluster-binding oxidoreductase [Bacteroidetes bacterium]|nr:MAG: iron-sulfur cluster-binding oxidoreductase [Bacteroidota bacterium]